MKKSLNFEGVFLLIGSLFFLYESKNLHMGDSIALSPALFPFIINTMIFLLSLRLIYKNNKEDKDHISIRTSLKNIRVINFIIVSFLFLFFMEKIGFLISSILYLVSVLLILGERRVSIILLISILTSTSLKYIFESLLDVYLP